MSYFTHAMLLSLSDRYHTPSVDKAADESLVDGKGNSLSDLCLCYWSLLTLQSEGHSATQSSRTGRQTVLLPKDLLKPFSRQYELTESKKYCLQLSGMQTDKTEKI